MWLAVAGDDADVAAIVARLELFEPIVVPTAEVVPPVNPAVEAIVVEPIDGNVIIVVAAVVDVDDVACADVACVDVADAVANDATIFVAAAE